MENIEFPLEYLNVTQKMDGSYSHEGTKAIDCTSKDEKTKKVYAPFTGTITEIYNKSHSIWFQSKDKVKFANGDKDYATVRLVHDNNINDLYVGKNINQGEYFYKMGDYGYATGEHVHIEISKGKQSGYKNQNEYGNYEMPNTINVYDGFFLNKEIEIKDSGGYNWKYDISNALKTKYKVGDKIFYKNIYTTSNTNKKLKPKYNSGTITKIYVGAKNPYLIDNNIGFVNDESIINTKTVKTENKIENNTLKVTPKIGLWLRDSKGLKIKAYKKGTKVTVIEEGYKKNGYKYYKVKINKDKKIGYMAKKYLSN